MYQLQRKKHTLHMHTKACSTSKTHQDRSKSYKTENDSLNIPYPSFMDHFLQFQRYIKHKETKGLVKTSQKCKIWIEKYSTMLLTMWNNLIQTNNNQSFLHPLLPPKTNKYRPVQKILPWIASTGHNIQCIYKIIFLFVVSIFVHLCKKECCKAATYTH